MAAGNADQGKVLTGQVEMLTRALWDVYVYSGADTDGLEGPGAMIAGSGRDGFARAVVESVKELHKDYSEALDESEELEHGLRQVQDAVLEMQQAEGQNFSMDELWDLYRAVIGDYRPGNGLPEKLQALIENSAGGSSDDYSEVRDLAGLVAGQATRHNKLMEVVKVHQRLIELQQKALKAHQAVLEKHEDTIGRLLLAVGTPEEGEL